MIIFIYLILLTTTYAACVPPGNIFPFPTYDHDDALAEISKNLTSLLDGIIDDPSFNGSTFSVAITTLNSTFFEYHHVGPLAENSTQNISGDSVYRIASNTKVFAVLLLLRAREQGLMNLDDPITKYIPELISGLSEVRWNQVTLRSTISHLSGLTREAGVFDLLRDTPFTVDPVQLGLPTRPPPREYACNSIPGSPDCSEENLISYIKNTERSYHVWDRPTYSNAGFALLGIALARVYNTTVNELFMDQVFIPANMTSSSMRPPEDNGVIPNVTNDWDLDLGDGATFGGQYASSNDLMNFHRSLLNGELLPRSVVNEWLKPVAYTGPLAFAYGAPWEIFNFEQFTSSNRTVNMYTKFGTLIGYYSVQFILPDYGVGGVILTAGTTGAIGVLIDAIPSVLIPQLEDFARERADQNYAGEYRSDEANSTLTITGSETSALEITSFISNGTDFINAMFLAQTHTPSESATPKFMLYPTDTFDTEDGLVHFRWVLEIEETSSEDNSTDEETQNLRWSLPLPPCFNDIAGWTYGGNSLSDVRFQFESGTVTSVSLPGLELDMQKQSTSSKRAARHFGFRGIHRNTRSEKL